MRQYGFLERDAKLTVGDVLRAQARGRRDPAAGDGRDPFPRSARRSRCCTSTASRSCRWSAPTIPSTIVGAIGERGLLQRAAEDPALLDAADRRGDGAAVRRPCRAEDPVREAVELLVGDQQALLVTRRRPRRRARHAHRPAGSIGVVSDAEPPRDAFATRAVHAGPDPGPDVRLGDPGDPPDVDLRPARGPGEFVEDYDYARSANPTRAALEQALGELEGGRAVDVRVRSRRRARADHRRLRGRIAHRAAGRPVRRHVPARRQGA